MQTIAAFALKILGYRQMVRHAILVRAFVGSNPTILVRRRTDGARLGKTFLQ